MNWKEHRNKLLKTDKEFREEWNRFDLWFELKQLWLKIKSTLKKLKGEGRQ